MKKLTLALGATVLLLLATACSTKNAEQIVEKALQAQDNIESYYGEVTATYQFDGETDTSTYKEWLVKPNKSRMEGDAGNLHVSNGKESWSYDETDHTVIVFDGENLGEEDINSEKQMMREILEDMLNENDVQVIGKEKVANRQTYHLSLDPLNKDDVFAMYNEIWIDTEYYMPLKMKIEGDDFSILTEYTQIDFNIEIDDNKFEFNVPEGANVQYWSDIMPKPMTMEELKETVPFTIPEINYVPEGFSFVEAIYFDDMDLAILDYRNNKDEFLSISVSINNDDEYQLEDAEEIKIGNITGSIATYSDITSLTWKKDHYSFDITATISKEEVIKIATEMN